MNLRKSKVALDNLITSALLVLIFLFTNLNVSRSTLATDFSGSGLYTLQEPTIQLLDNVDDLLKITYYYSPNLAPKTPDYVNLEREVSYVLQLYSQYGGENVQVNVVDPTDGAGTVIPEADQDRMARKGIVPMSEVIEREGEQIPTKFYSSIEISYGANDRVINKIGTDDVASLENTITQEIQYALNPELVHIGLYIPPRIQQPRRRRRRGGQPPEPQRVEDTRSFQDLETKLRNVGIVDRIFLKEGERFPDPNTSDLDVLVVAGLRSIPKSDLYALDQYIMNGGKAIIAADPVGLKPQPRRAAMMMGGGRERQAFLFKNTGKNEKTLLDLLKAYGVKGSANVTLDKSKARVDLTVNRQKTVNKGDDEQTRRLEESVNTEVPFLYQAKPVFSDETPSFINRARSPLVMLPMTFHKVSDAESTYKPWYTTSDFALEYESPGRSSVRALQRNTLVGYNIENQTGGKRRDLIVSLTGQMSSAFSSDEIPEPMTSDQKTDQKEGDNESTEEKTDGSSESSNQDADQKDDSSSDQSESTKNGHVKKVDSGELVLLGDADMLRLSQMSQIFGTVLREGTEPTPNETLIKGAVNYMGRSDGKQLNLEQEKIITPQITALSEGEKQTYRILLIAFPPLLVILFGLFRWFMMTYGRGQVES